MKRLILGALIATCLGVAAQAQTVTPGGGGCVAGSPCAASTMAIGGATLGGNALAVTGTSALSGVVTVPGGAAYNNPGFQVGSGGTGVGLFGTVTGTLVSNNVGVMSWHAFNGLLIKSTLPLAWSTADINGAGDTFLLRGGPANVQLGAAASATPVAQTISTQGSRAGTDTNTAGANLTVSAGQGTGTGTPSSLVLKSPIAVGSGTGAQTMTTGLTINQGTAATVGYTVSTLPAAPLTGARAHVTDAVACTFMGALTGGASTFCPVVYNGSAWVGG